MLKVLFITSGISSCKKKGNQAVFVVNAHWHDRREFINVVLHKKIEHLLNLLATLLCHVIVWMFSHWSLCKTRIWKPEMFSFENCMKIWSRGGNLENQKECAAVATVTVEDPGLSKLERLCCRSHCNSGGSRIIQMRRRKLILSQFIPLNLNLDITAWKWSQMGMVGGGGAYTGSTPVWICHCI